MCNRTNMPGSQATTGRSLEQTKDHVGLPIADILANISQEGANRVFVDYLQRTTPESQYLVGDAHDADCDRRVLGRVAGALRLRRG